MSVKSKEYIELKENYEKIEKQNKTLLHEKEQLLSIKSVLQTQKDVLSKEFEKIKNEKIEVDTNAQKHFSENAGLHLKLSEAEEKNQSL